WIDSRLEAVATSGEEPVAVRDTVVRTRLRWTAHGGVVLHTAVDAVEGERVVHLHSIELREREVGEVRISRPAIEALVKTAVAPDEQVVGVGRIDPDYVVVDVLVLLAHSGEGLPAILRDHGAHIHGVDAI